MASAARDPESTYRTGLASETTEIERLEETGSTLSRVRVALFVLLAVCVVLADPLDGTGEPVALAGAALIAVAFGLLVVRHAGLRRDIRRHRTLVRLHRLGLARLSRSWDRIAEAGLPDGPARDVLEDHAFAPDLHAFGRVSLFALLGPVTTVPGRRTVTDWLSSPAPAAPVRERQGAVRVLADRTDFRQRFAALGVEGPEVEPSTIPLLLRWCSGQSWLGRVPGLGVAAVAVPLLTLGLLTADLAAGWPAIWLLPLVVQVVILRRFHGRIAEAVAELSVGAPAVGRYSRQIAEVQELSGAPLLDRIRDAAFAERGPGTRGAPAALRSLSRRLEFAESRGNAFYRALDYALLIDIHVYRSLERWRDAHGADVARWLEALGQTEALCALATLAHDHPDWAFPELVEAGAEPKLVGESVGHPLLRPDRCVRNDVEIGPPGTFLLVTGSNMSGKSTLLRAVGANAILALAGGPVCADRFRMPVVRLRTSMLVGDSLADGVSRFMAELLRLKGVVDAARETRPGEGPVLYLLDEVLQGTNTAERRVAARTVLRHLLEEGAIGAVTTHDLTLHEAPDLERRARTFHFRESVGREDGRPSLHFDYRLRPGLSTTTNALELLEAVGLGAAESEDGDVDPSG